MATGLRRRTDTGRGGATAWRVPVGAFIVAVFIVCLRWDRTEFRLGRDGIETEATIVAFVDVQPPRATPYRSPVYEFVDTLGHRHRSTVRFEHAGLALGDTIRVTYLPDEPGVNRPGARGQTSLRRLLERSR